MKTLSSLENRVFLACAFVAVLSIALGTHFVTVRVSSEAEADLHRGLEQAAELLSDHHASRTETLTRMAWLIADLPKLKAAVATGDAPTVLPVAAEYRERVGSDVMVIRDGDGRVLASLGTDAAAWDEGGAFQGTAVGFLQIVTVPITIGLEPAEELGILSLGFFLNAELALELGELTQSEVVLRSDERVIATTVTEELVEAEDYVSTEVPLVEDGPVATLLRSRKERLSFLSTFREGLLLSALFGILLAIVLSYGVARTVTRPLLAITEAMSEMTSTGDLARKIELRGRWIDADATVLARAFNRLTESFARFQREAASRERLSALGRMSTVIAHEIRNPLMIIKASVRSFRKAKGIGMDEDVLEAADDIDHEVGRIDRIVGDVLDFARPLKLDLHPTDVNAVCRKAAQFVVLGEEAPRLAFRLDEGIPEIVTDGERLGMALVNVLSNARDAVVGRTGNGDSDIELATERSGKDAVAIVVRDHGVGLPRKTSRRFSSPISLASAPERASVSPSRRTSSNRSEGPSPPGAAPPKAPRYDSTFFDLPERAASDDDDDDGRQYPPRG